MKKERRIKYRRVSERVLKAREERFATEEEIRERNEPLSNQYIVRDHHIVNNKQRYYSYNSAFWNISHPIYCGRGNF